MVSFHCFCFTWFSSVALVSRDSSVSLGFSWLLQVSLVLLVPLVSLSLVPLVSLWHRGHESVSGRLAWFLWRTCDAPQDLQDVAELRLVCCAGHLFKHTTQPSNWGEKGNKDPCPRAAAPWQTSLTPKGFGVFEKFKMSRFLMQSLPFFNLYLVVSTLEMMR